MSKLDDLSRDDIFGLAAASRKPSGSGPLGYCPRCGCVRNIVEKKRLENFVVKETYQACSVCGSRVSQVAAAPVDHSEAQIAKKRLGALFGDGDKSATTPAKPILPKMDFSQVHFCRDCMHYLYHPFKSHCCLHDRDVEASMDCPQYTPKPKKPKF